MPLNYTTIIPLYDSAGDLISANKATYTKIVEQTYLDFRADIDYLGNLIGMNSYSSNWNADGQFIWTQGTTIEIEKIGSTLFIKFSKSLMTDFRTACEDMYTKQSLGTITWTIDPVVPLYNTDFSIISANKATYTDVRKLSLYTNIQDALKAVAETAFIFIDITNGDDTTGDGTYDNPYQTWLKAVTIVNASGGNIFLKEGEYSSGSTHGQLTADNVLVKGASLGKVILNARSGTASGATFKTAHGFTLEDVVIPTKDYGSYYSRGFYLVNDCNSATLRRCIFNSDDTQYSSALLRFDGTNGTLDHCSFVGTKGTYTYDGIFADHAALTLKDCLFLDLDDCVYFTSAFNGNVTEDNCGWYGYDNIYAKDPAATYNLTYNNRLTTDPEITNKVTCYLSDTSPYIEQASDGYDIGAHLTGKYNVLRTITETITIAESPIRKQKYIIHEDINAFEGINVTTMNLEINMALWGLFRSSATGVVEYLDKTEITAPHASFTYNGASLDVSFDNTGGDNCELYISYDDGISDYDDVVWWELARTQYGYYAGNGTSGYFIDAWKDIITNDEWGKGFAFSTVTADGVNNKQADITIHLRVYNTITKTWSELLTKSKTYNFNDFEKTIFYCGDNPRIVDSEYANHVNYYAQEYHSGTNKYVRPDGINWSADGRRFAYNPMFKTDKLIELVNNAPTQETVYGWWQDRYCANSPMGFNNIKTDFMLYACVAVNFGNWNYNGISVFDNFDANMPYDKGSPTLSNPVLKNAESGLHYIRFTPKESSDCQHHASHASIAVRFPSGDNIVWGDFCGKHYKLNDAEIYFQQGNNPFTACLPENRYYFWIKDYTGDTPGGYAAYIATSQIYQVNRDYYGYAYGNLFYHWFTSSTPASTGTLTEVAHL